MKFTFGTDPEFMLRKDGKYYSAIGIVEGTRNNRLSINGHQFYYDNVLAECAVKPASTKEEAVENIRECIEIYSDMVKPYELCLTPFHKYDLDQLQHEDARQSHCKEEYCAYSRRRIEVDEAYHYIKNTGFRASGGHVHLGGDFKDEPLNIISIVKCLDLFLGLPLNMMCDQVELRKKRRTMYGKSGRHRLPAHGLEYRVLDNFWLCSPHMVRLVWDICDFCLDFNEEFKTWWKGKSCKHYKVQDLRKAIDKYDMKLATEISNLIFKYIREDMHLPVPHETFYNRNLLELWLRC